MNFRWHPFRARTAGLAGSLALELALLCAGVVRLRAADPASFVFRTNDVIAFVGGEDVVEMQRNGYLELLLTAALPHHKLRFRNLAFEGDTVFEQHRQLNFPSWEKQLERVGATVVIAQFGQAESLQGTNGLAKFIADYEKLLNRFTNGGRRLVLLSPTPIERKSASPSDFRGRTNDLMRYASQIREVARQRHHRFVDLSGCVPLAETARTAITRDGLHLDATGHWVVALVATEALVARSFGTPELPFSSGPIEESLREIIVAKNRLWFDYWRPQNWAFLHGDRTEQASSRDHRDPKKRWFPEEMQKFLPLIEAKEKKIWKLAEELK